MNNSSKPAGNLFNAIAKNAQATTTRAANAIVNAASNTTKAVNDAVTNVAKNIPVVNSLLPLTNTGANSGSANSVAKAANAAVNGVANAVNGVTNAANAALNAANNTFKNIIPSANNSAAAGWSMPWWGWYVIIFVVIAGIATTLFVVYSKEISDGINSMFGWTKAKSVPEPRPLDISGAAFPTAAPAPESTSLLGKLLPSGSPAKEVFNVSSNEFTYYDAEPMCRALGAELATYDQVMDAWKKGADWCNYGWIKGQSAIYPTQKDTYDKLQNGPEEDQQACGKPGVNGGFFDNPEMRFGVNCYGVKPSQTANDQRMLEERGVLPRSTATLMVDQQAQEYKDRLASIGVLPFNEKEWSTA